MNRMFPRMDPYIGTADMNRLRLQTHVISGAPESVRGLRAAFVSDIHLRANIRTAPLIDCIRNCRADIIFFGGDFADKRPQALRLFEALRSVSAPMGMYAAPGNNDIEAFGSMKPLKAALSHCGVQLLVNRTVRLDGFSVGGLNERKYSNPPTRNIFSARDEYRILLSHYPIFPKERVDLMLSGHTHGGQFNAFGLTPYSIGFEGIGKKKHLAPAAVSGFHEIDGAKLLVSKGVGTSRIPMRIGVIPEIHLLKFEC